MMSDADFSFTGIGPEGSFDYDALKSWEPIDDKDPLFIAGMLYHKYYERNDKNKRPKPLPRPVSLKRLVSDFNMQYCRCKNCGHEIDMVNWLRSLQNAIQFTLASGKTIKFLNDFTVGSGVKIFTNPLAKGETLVEKFRTGIRFKAKNRSGRDGISKLSNLFVAATCALDSPYLSFERRKFIYDWVMGLEIVDGAEDSNTILKNRGILLTQTALKKTSAEALHNKYSASSKYKLIKPLVDVVKNQINEKEQERKGKR